MNTLIVSSKYSPRVSRVRNPCFTILLPYLDKFTVHEDTAIRRVEDLEAENETLRRKLDTLERELQSRSPTRSARKAAQPQPAIMDDHGTTLFQLNCLALNSEKSLGLSPSLGKTPRKVRKLTARKWDLCDENELDGYLDY